MSPFPEPIDEPMESLGDYIQFEDDSYYKNNDDDGVVHSYGNSDSESDYDN